MFHDAVHGLARSDYTAEQLRAWAPPGITPARWPERTANLVLSIFVIQGLVAGFIGFSEAGYIDLLFTRPEFARRGVGSALLRDAEGQLRARGISIATTEASITARPFFEAMGYEVVREQTVRCRGVEFRNFKMSKALVPAPVGKAL